MTNIWKHTVQWLYLCIDIRGFLIGAKLVRFSRLRISHPIVQVQHSHLHSAFWVHTDQTRVTKTFFEVFFKTFAKLGNNFLNIFQKFQTIYFKLWIRRQIKSFNSLFNFELHRDGNRTLKIFLLFILILLFDIIYILLIFKYIYFLASCSFSIFRTLESSYGIEPHTIMYKMTPKFISYFFENEVLYLNSNYRAFWDRRIFPG